MLIDVNKASGRTLDYLVAAAEGLEVITPAWADADKAWLQVKYHNGVYRVPCPAYRVDPAESQPILERERISVLRGDFYSVHATPQDLWMAVPAEVRQRGAWFYGPTMLVAGLRCYVAYKLGATYDVPDIFNNLKETMI